MSTLPCDLGAGACVLRGESHAHRDCSVRRDTGRRRVDCPHLTWFTAHPARPPARPTPRCTCTRCSRRAPTRPPLAADVRRELDDLVARARASCAACPLFAECLYSAVVQRDVAGFVGCTTPAERDAIRDRLGAAPEREDLDAAAGVRGERRPLDHEAVLAARAAYPDDSLEMLSHRLECSLSTVKRHLRRARRESAGGGADRRPAGPAVHGRAHGRPGAGRVRRRGGDRRLTAAPETGQNQRDSS